MKLEEMWYIPIKETLDTIFNTTITHENAIFVLELVLWMLIEKQETKQ